MNSRSTMCIDHRQNNIRGLIIVRSFCYDNGYLAFTLYCWADIVRCAPLPLSPSTIRIRGIQLEDNASSVASFAACTRVCLSFPLFLVFCFSLGGRCMQCVWRCSTFLSNKEENHEDGCRLRRLLNYEIFLILLILKRFRFVIYNNGKLR